MTLSDSIPEGATPSALEPTDWSAFRAQAHEALDALIDQMANARERAAWKPLPSAVRERLRRPFTNQGEGVPAALHAAIEDVLPYPTGNAHPRFWGWVHGSGVPAAILGDWLAAGMNANNFGAEQSAAYVELAVLDWLKSLVGFPADATGLMVSGGSMANLIGLAVARNERAGADVRELGVGSLPKPLRFYASTETHSSVRKAVELLGLGAQALGMIPVGEDYRIDLHALRAQIEADRAAGLQPIAVIANAGTVNTGAVDDLPALAGLAAEHALWLHVDGAIGVAARLTGRGREMLRGIERADSIGLDLHKWLYVPYECGAVLVRAAGVQRRSFEVTASYLARLSGGTADGPFAFNEHGVQLSRGNKALKVWLALRALGTDAFANTIDANLDQARYLAERVRATPELEVLAPVALSIVCLRYRGRGIEESRLNALNQCILIALQERGIAVPSGTVLRGRFAIRVSITNHRTERADLDALVAAVLTLGREFACR